MNYYLLNARSVTHAQQLSQVLQRAGINASIRRIGNGLTKGGCGYTLQIAERRFPAASGAMRESRVFPVKVFHVTGGEKHEVML